MSSESKRQEIDRSEIPQYGMVASILMFAWPAVWFTVLIYVVGRQFILDGGTTPTWVLLYLFIGLVFNILGEEIYYRGYLLPRMRGTFGKWD